MAFYDQNSRSRRATQRPLADRDYGELVRGDLVTGSGGRQGYRPPLGPPEPVPDWPTTLGWDDQRYSDYLGARSGDFDDAFDLEMQQTADNQQAIQALLDQIYGQSQSQAEGFQSSKEQASAGIQGVLDDILKTEGLWGEYAAPDYEAITTMALEPARQAVARSAAGQIRSTQDLMAGRGLGRSGISASLQGAAAGRGMAGQAQLEGERLTKNEELRRLAAQQLGNVQGMRGDLSTALANVELAQNPYELGYASLGASLLPLQNTDYISMADLAHRLDMEETELAQLSDALSRSDAATGAYTEGDPFGDFLTGAGGAGLSALATGVNPVLAAIAALVGGYAGAGGGFAGGGFTNPFQ